MVIKLSAYLWFRNTLVDILNNPRHMNWPHFSDEDVKKLRSTIEQIDEMHDRERETKINPSPVIGPNVLIPGGYPEIVEHPPRPPETRKLYGEIFRILQEYWVGTYLYLQLGDCFDELHLKPEDDVAEAIGYARGECKYFFDRDRNSLEKICWKNIRETKERGR